MAKFYVNRGGGRVPEGPFEEEQIVRLIRAGKLRSGYASEVGSQRFFPLESQPSFARALSEAGVPADPATAMRVTAGPKVRGATSSKNTSRGLLLGAVLSIFGLALAAVAIGSYVMFSNGGMPIRGAVPTDTELLVEVRSVPQLFTDLRALRVVDTSRLLNEQFWDDAAQALSDAFGLPKSRARALLASASSLGFAGRKLAGTPEGGVLLSFGSAAPVNAFLSSARFTYTGLVAKNGRKYRLAAGSEPAAASLDRPLRELALLAPNPATTVICWFETSKVLFVGSPSFADSIARVVSLDVPSLEQSPVFKKAEQDLAARANVVGYLDSAKLAELAEPTLEAFLAGKLKSGGPVSVSLDVVPAGLVSHWVSHIANGSSSPGSALGPAPRLSLVDRLPAEAFAYVAASTESTLPGAELEKQLVAGLAASSPELAERVRSELTRSEQRWHLQAADFLGALGNQAVVAVLARPDYAIALGDPVQTISSFALEYVQALKDEAPARAAGKALVAELSGAPSPYSMEQDADGYRLTSKDGAVGARLRFLDGNLFLAVGDAGLVERSWSAFAHAEKPLSADAAHRAARAALPSSARLVAWLDVGRVVDAVQKNPILALAAKHPSFDEILAPHWTGPDRVSAGLTVSSVHQPGEDSYRVDALNLPIVAGAYRLLAP